MPYMHENLTKYPEHPNARAPLPEAYGTLSGMGRSENMGKMPHKEANEAVAEEMHETVAQEKAEC